MPAQLGQSKAAQLEGETGMADRLFIGLAMAAALAAGPAAAQTKAKPTETPGDLCVTNSCVKTAKITRDQAAIDRAIKAGNAGDVIRAGGSPEDAAAAFRSLCDQPGKYPCRAIPAPGKARWGVFADGTLGLAGQTSAGMDTTMRETSMNGSPHPSTRSRPTRGTGRPRVNPCRSPGPRSSPTARPVMSPSVSGAQTGRSPPLSVADPGA